MTNTLVVTDDILVPHSPLSYIFYFLLGVIVVLTIYHFWLQSLRYVKLGNQIPGPPSLPILGNIHMAIGQNPNKIMDLVLSFYNKMESDVGKIWVGPKLYVGLADPLDVELILGSTVHLEKSQEYALFEPWLGEGLLISKGEKWKSHRKMIAPTFHSSILKSFMPIFNKNANNLLISLEKEKRKIFDVHDYMSGTTVDILLETAMGVKKTDADNTGYDYAKAVMDMCNILHLRHYKIWLRSDIIFKLTKMATEQTKLLNTIHKLTKRVIRRKKEDFYVRASQGEKSLYKEAVKASEYHDLTVEKTENFKFVMDELEEIEENDIGEKKRLAFLDFMIEASQTSDNKLTDDEIKEEVDTIMFEGHDTTAAASSFTLCLLGCHPEIQEKCLAELKEIFNDNMVRPITFADTLKMKYLERVILETLRLYPPVPVIARKINQDVKLESKNYIVPAGTTVIIGQYVIHRNPKYWTNPTVFDPDNFLPKRCQERHYFSYIPFSAGPRSCVGRKYAMLKLKVILASIVRKYKITSVKREADFTLQADIILKRSDGFSITIEDRNNQG